MPGTHSLHSRSRIVVERANGMVKNRFRMLKVPLNQKPSTSKGRSETEEMGRMIAACLVLHNILIDLQDTTDLLAGEGGNVLHDANDIQENVPDRNVALQKRDQIQAISVGKQIVYQVRHMPEYITLLHCCPADRND